MKAERTNKISNNNSMTHSYIKVLFITVLLLLFFTNYIHSYRTIQLFEQLSPLYPNDVITFQESSIITIRLANSYCLQGGGNQNSLNVIFLRSFYPNGTDIIANINFTNPAYNFCPLNGTNTFALPGNTLLMSYLREEQANQVRFMGLITTLDGIIINPGLELSDALNLNINGSIYPSYITTVKANHDTESGGLLFTITYDNLNITWRKFALDHEGKGLYGISQGVITPTVPPSEQYEIDSFQTFETLEGGYGLVYSISLTNPLSHSLVYFTLLHYNSTIWTPPTIIYESPANSKITIKSCAPSVDTSSAGFTCFITMALQPELQWKMINFLSVGSVQSYQDVPNSEIKFESSRNIAVIYTDVLALNHDGFAMIGKRQDNLKIQGRIYNITGGKVVRGDDWGIPSEPIIKYSALNNDTVWSAIPGEDNSGTFWYIISNDIYTNEVANENMYENKQILSTVPPINGTISKDTKSIIIKYKDPIVLSTGFISIYKRSYDNNTTTDLLRQAFSASSQYVQYVNAANNTEVEVQVLSSTFSQSNSSYYIKIDDNFVKNQYFNEPLMGIESGVWMINTNNTVEDQKFAFADDKNVLLRLDRHGTLTFLSMELSEQYTFFDNLLFSFSQSIPVSIKRLQTSKRHQFDGMRDDLPILINIQLKATRSKEEMNTDQILDNMNILVKNKMVTKLNDFENASDLLDSDFGAEEIVNVWVQYRYQIAGIICAIFILCVLVFLAHNTTNPTDPKNSIPAMSLFKFVIIFVDFIMDVIFLFYNSRDLQNLYTPSIVLLLAPLSVNFFITMFIFLKEYYGNTAFANFARENSLSTTILLVIGYIDLISLELLSSHLANIHILSAPLDSLADRTIYWGSLAILLVEDLPQLVIQIIYLKSVIVYKFVPLLTLITGSLIILTNLVGRTYDCYRNIRDHYYISSDEEYQDNNSNDGRGKYLIGVDRIDEIFNKGWVIGSGKASSQVEKNEKEKGKGKSKEDGNFTEGSGVGGGIEQRIDFDNDTQVVVAGPSGNTTTSNESS